MHSLLTTKKVIVLNQMFYKITSHKFNNGLAMVFQAIFDLQPMRDSLCYLCAYH
jgi:hypothetical protein